MMYEYVFFLFLPSTLPSYIVETLDKVKIVSREDASLI